MIYEQHFKIEFSYPVIFTNDLFGKNSGQLLSVLPERHATIMIFIDSGVAEHHPTLGDKIREWVERNTKIVTMAAEIQTVPGGEKAKNDPAILDNIIAAMVASGLCKHCYVIAIGGGSVLDVVGYAASVVHRGIRHIRMPTTVLAQNDAGLGVKNGVNRFGMKNLLGTFTTPAAVINDCDFLTTLSRRDWTSGIAEAIKVGIIKDETLLEFIDNHCQQLQERDARSMRVLIERCAILHLEHIKNNGDPFETGSSRPLDFGHWAGHRLEMLSENQLTHGQAVAIGIALDMFCARDLGLVTAGECEYCVSLLKKVGLPVWDELLKVRDEAGNLQVLKGLEHFRQHLGGQLTVAMPDGLGRLTEINELPTDIITKSTNALEDWNRQNEME